MMPEVIMWYVYQTIHRTTASISNRNVRFQQYKTQKIACGPINTLILAIRMSCNKERKSVSFTQDLVLVLNMRPRMS